MWISLDALAVIARKVPTESIAERELLGPLACSFTGTVAYAVHRQMGIVLLQGIVLFGYIMQS